VPTDRPPPSQTGWAASVRRIPVASTRELRQAELRPGETVAQMAATEAVEAVAFGAFDGPRLVAVGLVAPDDRPGSWRVRGMATTAEARGRGAGTAVLDALLRHAAGAGAVHVWCNARVGARSLYERAGFRATSIEFELPEIGPHVVMELDLVSSRS
jgi:GNAT superfamily N-acetyltransferase